MVNKVKFVLKIDRSAKAAVAERAERLQSTGASAGFGNLGTSIHFLRGVGSRATFALASFYLLLGANVKGSNPCTVPGYPGRILQSQIYFASLNTIALACRKVFDHGKGLTGAKFGRESDETLRAHAEYWAKNSSRPVEDAYRALHLLRAFFANVPKNQMHYSETELRSGAVSDFSNSTPIAQQRICHWKTMSSTTSMLLM